MSKMEKFGLGLIVFILVGLFVACSYEADDSEIPDTSDYRDYHYLDGVTINNGFYKGFECVVLRERRKTITCKVVKEVGGFVLLSPGEQSRVDISKTQVSKIQ